MAVSPGVAYGLRRSDQRLTRMVLNAGAQPPSSGPLTTIG
jgi:hypothetical protein